MASKEYDIVVYGATGFTGRLIVEYLAQNTDPSTLKWAISGRDSDKLFRLKNAIAAENETLSDVGVIVASNEDYESLVNLAQSAKVIITLAGPYAEYGELLVKACVESSTHCLDLSGEPNYVGGIYKDYNFPAERSGSIIISSCGFDSVPADLGAFYTALQLGEGDGKVIQSYVSVKGSVSGGTLRSAIENLEKRSLATLGEVEFSVGHKKFKSFHYQKLFKKWGIPMPVIDPVVVGRSSRARKDIYGDNFSYAQYIGLSHLLKTGAVFAGLGTLILASKSTTVKNRLTQWRKSGEGPSEDQRSKSHFKLNFIGTLEDKQVFTSVSGGDPGYSETAKMIGEAALLLVEEPNKFKGKGGVHTPAGVLGQKYLERLHQKGILFERVK